VIHCSEASLLITALVDGELDLAEMDRIKTHLGLCEDCAARRRMEARLKGFLKESLSKVDTPQGLDQRIRGALSGLEVAPEGEDLLPPCETTPNDPPPPSKGGGNRSALRLPLVLLVLILSAMMVTQVVVKLGSDREGTGTSSALAIELDAVHAAATGAGVFQVASRKQDVLNAWFTEHLGSSIAVPDLTSVGLVPVGGRVVRIFGAPMAMVLFKDPAEPAVQPSLTLIHGSLAADKDGLSGEVLQVDAVPVRLDAMGPLSMASFGEAEHAWMLVSEGPSEFLIGVVRTLLGR